MNETDPITWQSLATVAGASGASAGLVAFVRIFATLSPSTARRLAAIFGVLLVELAIVILGKRGLAELGLGFFNGVAAGLAASKSVEILQHGLNHRIVDSG